MFDRIAIIASFLALINTCGRLRLSDVMCDVHQAAGAVAVCTTHTHIHSRMLCYRIAHIIDAPVDACMDFRCAMLRILPSAHAAVATRTRESLDRVIVYRPQGEVSR